jgi:hypothetical protein
MKWTRSICPLKRKESILNPGIFFSAFVILVSMVTNCVLFDVRFGDPAHKHYHWFIKSPS